MMKYKNKYIIILLIFQFFSSFSQVTDIVWQQCFVTENYSTDAYCIEQFGNGYLVGIYVGEDYSPTSNYHGGGDSWYVYIDTIGNIIWEKCYGGTGMDQPVKIVPINKNYYYLINLSTSIDGDVMCENNGEADVWIAKIDTLGNIIWQNCYGGPDFEFPRDAILTPDGGLLIMSRIFDGGGDITNFYGLYDNWLCKIDTLGKIEWETTIGSIGRDNGLKLLLTEGNTYLALCDQSDIGGMSECEPMGSPGWSLDLWLVELDLKGNILRQDCYGGTSSELGWDIIETIDGYIILSSTKSNDLDVSGNHGESDFWLLKIDKDHEILWQKCLGGSSYDYPTYLTQTEDGGYMLFGSTHSNYDDVSGNHSNASDVWVVKTDSVGEPLWQHCFGSVAMDWFWGQHTILKKNDYNYVLAPITMGNGGDVYCQQGVSLERNWIFEIKDCSLYQPTTPQQPTGQDTLCAITDSITTYTTQFANGAWAYEWELVPGDAGILVPDSLTATIHWNPLYEGEATIKVRSYNDCGTSEWSNGIVVNIYICLGTEEISTNPATIMVYPNPASNWAQFNYTLPTNTSTGEIIITDITGKFITRLTITGSKGAKLWDTRNTPNGVYLYTLQAIGFSSTGKIVISE